MSRLQGRRSARVQPEDEGQVRAILDLAGGPVEGGVVVDVSSGGCRLRFAQEHSPGIPVGSLLPLHLQLPRLGRSFPLKARVVSREEGGDSRSYRLVFLDVGPRAQEIDRTLFLVFNRREEVRVEPDPGRPPGLELGPLHGSPPAPATLVNISAAGLAAAVTPEVEAELADVDHVRLVLMFPGRPEPVTLEARVLGRTLEGGRVLYRTCYVPRPTPEHREKMRVVVDYVMARQMELLRAAR